MPFTRRPSPHLLILPHAATDLYAGIEKRIGKKSGAITFISSPTRITEWFHWAFK